MMAAKDTDYMVPIREFVASKQASLFQTLKQPQFSGQLLLTDPKGRSWTFYIYLGRIIYATGGVHPVRRWRRNLIAQTPAIAPELSKLLLFAANVFNFKTCWDYELLCLWVEQEKINREQVAKIIRSAIVEVFFDMTQAVQVTYEFKPDNELSLKQLVLIDADQVIAEAGKIWQAWQGSKIANRSPNEAPVIRQQSQLQAQTSPKTYQVLTKLLDGQHTLRDLAIQMKRDLVQVTRSLMPYIQLGLIELVDIPDLTTSIAATPKRKSPPRKQQDQKGALIACVDDSPMICQTMEKILKEAGYQFVAINDALRAIAILLARKPDLIFLDLVMPNGNGYEICGQLRKLSIFRNTPIVILTGNDGLVDRVRAKMVGSDDFLGKPVEANKVLGTIRKYLNQENTREDTQT